MIDKVDKKILALLQDKADLSLNEVAERVNLSKNPCWRRIQKLQDSGVIRKRVALLDAKQLNLGVTVFVNIRTTQHTVEWLKNFARVVDEIAEIVEFYRMSGDVDYMLKVVVPSIEAYDAVYKRMIKKVDIANVSSYFAMEEIKNTTALPLGY